MAFTVRTDVCCRTSQSEQVGVGMETLLLNCMDRLNMFYLHNRAYMT